MKYIHSSENKTYTAPIIANGKLSLTISPDGSMAPDNSGKLIAHNIGRAIFRVGKRIKALPYSPYIQFGRFTQTLAGNSPILPTTSEQELDADRAEVICETTYTDGSTVRTTAFVDHDRELVIVRKSFSPASRFTYSFDYQLCNIGGGRSEFMSITNDGRRIFWKSLDQPKLSGNIAVFTDAENATVSSEDNRISISLEIEKPLDATFYILFDAESDGASDILSVGFEKLRASHSENWSEFYRKGYASVGDETLDRAYKTALYHLRSYATEYSMPVGLNDSAWNGRFFAFDEHYMFEGLASSNHFEEAKRVPVFRKNGLGIAKARASSSGKNAARYPWETLEDGSEAAPIGFWYDHIFHMAMIALSEYQYYLYTLDKEFLKETAYPVIAAAAEFYAEHSLYMIGGRLIVGKCTDLERLGSAVENAYMTTCGVAATFRAFSGAARTLGVDAELADKYEKLANQLLESLPNDGTRYLPYPGCEARSISAFSGTYPFDVIGRDDRLQLAAIDDYLENEDVFGNMYAVGRGVCSWYACWKSIVFTRLGRKREAFDSLVYVARTAGDFGEMFEINNRESGAYYHPWFTTAAGILVLAVDELLARVDEEGRVALASGLDEGHGDFDFRLAVQGGISVEAKAENGRLAKLSLTPNTNCDRDQILLTIPERFIVGTDFEKLVRARKAGIAELEISFVNPEEKV